MKYNMSNNEKRSSSGVASNRFNPFSGEDLHQQIGNKGRLRGEFSPMRIFSETEDVSNKGIFPKGEVSENSLHREYSSQTHYYTTKQLKDNNDSFGLDRLSSGINMDKLCSHYDGSRIRPGGYIRCPLVCANEKNLIAYFTTYDPTSLYLVERVLMNRHYADYNLAVKLVSDSCCNPPSTILRAVYVAKTLHECDIVCTIVPGEGFKFKNLEHFDRELLICVEHNPGPAKMTKILLVTILVVTLRVLFKFVPIKGTPEGTYDLVYIPFFDKEDLVGIEHNPGPDFLWILILNLICGIALTDHIIVAGITSTNFIARVVSIQICWILVSVMLLCKVLILFDREDLVGIEHNPGPDMLISYLKNMERLEERVTTRKRSTQVAKTLLSLKKKKSKDKFLEIQSQRSKRLIMPEGLFEVGLDAETREYLSSLVDHMLNGVKPVEVHHRISLSLTDKLSNLLEYLRSVSRRVYNFVVGILKLAASFLSDAARDFLFAFFPPKDEDQLESELFYDLEESVEAEMDIPWHSLMSMLYLNHFSDIVQRSEWTKLTTLLYDIKKESKTTEGAIGILKKVAEELGVFLSEAFGLDIPFLLQVDPEVMELQQEAKSIFKEYAEGTSNDYLFANRVYAFQSVIEDRLYERRGTVAPKTKEKLQYLLRKFDPVVKYCQRNINPNNGPRIEPLAILVAGPTGVGKSTMTIPFLLALMRNILDKDKIDQFLENHNDFIFYRATENEYWDGYKARNACLVYDDFGQQRDVAGSPSVEGFEIIRLKNTAPYHLHFAGIEDKQRHYAVPKVIFATSNLSKLHFESLNCSEAVIRRFDLAYIMVPKSQYSKDTGDNSLWNRRLDMEKVRKDFPYDPREPSTYASFDVVDFIPWNFATGTQAAGPVLSFKEFLCLAIRKHREISTKGDVMLRFHGKMKNFVMSDADLYPQQVVAEIGDSDDEAFEDASEEFVLGTDLKKKMLQALKDVASGVKKYASILKPNSLEELLPYAKAFVGFLGSIITLYNLTKLVHPGKSAELYEKKEVRRNATRTSKEKREAIVRRNLARGPGKVVLPEDASQDLNPYLKLLKRNMYRLIASKGDKALGWVIFVGGRTFLMPKHFDCFLNDSIDSESASSEETIHVYFRNAFSNKDSFVLNWFTDIDVIDYEECERENDYVPRDYIFVKIKERKCREHSDISDYFPIRENIKDTENYKSVIAVQRENMTVFLSTVVSYHDNRGMNYNSYSQSFRSDSISYYVATSKGDCGSVLLTQDPRFGRPTILGIHTAGELAAKGKEKLAFGVLIDRHQVKQVLLDAKEEYLSEPYEVDEVELEGFNAIKRIKGPRVPSRSKIVYSPMSEFLWEKKFKPAHLRPFSKDGVVIDPSYVARIGYSHDEVWIDSLLLGISHAQVVNLVLRKQAQAPWSPRLLTFEEVVKGVNGVEYMESINRSTSPGYPYVMDNRKKGKIAWFGDKAEIDIENPKAQELKSKVMSIIEKAKSGKRSEHIFVDYLKDERRPIEKVDKGKTRQFMACGMDLLICMKMYFGDFVRHVCQNRIHNGIALGIDPYTEWTTLVKYLIPTEEMVVTAGDFSKFDARIPVEIGYKVLEIVEAFYVDATEEERRVREVLFLEVINSMHITHGVMYEFVGGNPSGQYLTPVFNSIANLEMLAYMIILGMRDTSDYDKFPNVFKELRLQVFGDDNLIAYPKKYENWCGQYPLAQAAKEGLGMEYTSEQKDKYSGANSRKISEVSFLKRGFLLQKDGSWNCPLDIDVLKETLSWQKENGNISEMKERIESVLSEISRHGREVFEELSPRIIKASLRCYNYQPQCSTYLQAVGSKYGLSE